MIGHRPVVIDASVMIARLLAEPEAGDITAALGRWKQEARPIVVPGHFWLELVNRIGRVPNTTGSRTLASVHLVDAFRLETVDMTRPMLVQVIDRMERHRLSAYDAGYLVLAESLDADLVTLDRALAAAAGARAIGFGDSHRLHEAPAPYEHDVTWPDYKGASAYLAKLRAEALAAG